MRIPGLRCTRRAGAVGLDLRVTPLPQAIDVLLGQAGERSRPRAKEDPGIARILTDSNGSGPAPRQYGSDTGRKSHALPNAFPGTGAALQRRPARTAKIRETPFTRRAPRLQSRPNHPRCGFSTSSARSRRFWRRSGITASPDHRRVPTSGLQSQHWR